MSAEQSMCCCSLIEIGDFWEKFHTKEHILRAIKMVLRDYLDDDDLEFPTSFFATTRSTILWNNEAAASLKEIGFKSKKFKSRHDTSKEKTMTHWFIDGIPKDLRKWVREEVSRIKKERKNDNW